MVKTANHTKFLKSFMKPWSIANPLLMEKGNQKRRSPCTVRHTW